MEDLQRMIAIDATPLVLGPRRGVARALSELLAGMAGLDAPVRLFAPGPLPDGTPSLGGVTEVRAPSARAFRRQMPARLRAEGARVLLAPWSAFPATDLPVVVVVHEVPFVRHPGLEGRWRALRHRLWLRRNATCAGVIVPSEATRDDVLAASRVVPDRVHVIPNAFDPGPWEVAGEQATDGGPDVVMVGTGVGRGRKKGLDVLFAALRILGPDPLDVAVVGEVGGAVPAGVRVVGPLSDAELRAFVAGARVLVHPARSEGFGYPPLEAMAAGVPVVTTDGGSLPEVTGDAALRVPAGDAEALARALDATLHEDDVRRGARVERGRHQARAFVPRVVARQVLDLLESIAEAGG